MYFQADCRMPGKASRRTLDLENWIFPGIERQIYWLGAMIDHNQPVCESGHLNTLAAWKDGNEAFSRQLSDGSCFKKDNRVRF